MVIGERAIIKMLVRYNGIGKELTSDEKEILMFALHNESEAREGIAYKALEECKKIAGRKV